MLGLQHRRDGMIIENQMIEDEPRRGEMIIANDTSSTKLSGHFFFHFNSFGVVVVTIRLI